MKKWIYLYLIITTLLTPHVSLAANSPNCPPSNCRGQASTYGSSYSLASSMALWGTLLFLGIGVLAIVLANEGQSHSHSN